MSEDENIFLSPSEKKWVCILVGFIYYAVAVAAVLILLPVVQSQKVGNDEYTILGNVLIVALGSTFVLAVHSSIRGCFRRQYEIRTYGYFFHWMGLCLLLLFCTMPGYVVYIGEHHEEIGYIFIFPSVLWPLVFYWTGRGLLRMYFRETLFE
jgi:hypothetical protein